MHYERLFEPLVLGNLKLKNRFVKAAYSSTNSDERGYVLDSAVHHYDAVARGGVGLFITESVAVAPDGVSGSPRMAIWDDSYVPGQRRLADAVHAYGTPIIMQLQHAGPSFSTGAYGGWSDASVERLEPRGPSSLTQDELPGPRSNLPKGLSLEEIHELVETFTLAAERAARAGYDGVQLHGAISYLIATFFSRAWNKRTDEYGGSIENRCRFAVDITKSIRKRLGPDFIISIRYNGVELGARHGDGITYAESTQIAEIMESAGIDLVDITLYGYNHFELVTQPEQMLYPAVPSGAETFAAAVREGAPLLEAASNVKRAVGIPVITVGFSFDRAEQALRDGSVDLVAFARALMSDPDAPRKLEAGRSADVRPCTYCMTCLDTFMRGEHERCRVNASFAKEQELAIIPVAEPARVLVVGGGPAGLEAARVARLRGHDVTLYERERNLGGLMPLMSFVKGTGVEKVTPFTDYLIRQLAVLGVDVHRNKSVDVSLVRRLRPDAVVVATGSSMRLPDVPGIQSKNVLTTQFLHKWSKLPLRTLGPRRLEVLSRRWLPMVGKRVAIVGGAMEGIELAEFLVHRGRQVTVVESGVGLGSGIIALHRNRALTWLRKEGATLLDGVVYDEITDRGVRVTTSEGESSFIPSDTTIVLALREPDLTLERQLQGDVPKVVTVGDAARPGLIVDAIEDGYRAALAIELPEKVR